MRSFALHLPLAVATLAALAVGTPAVACDPGILVESSAPADAATDVPTNAQLFVFFSYTNDWLDLSLSRSDTGADVPGAVSIRPGGNLEDRSRAVAVFLPTAELPSDTSFDLTLQGDFRDGSTEQTVSFTTGSGPLTGGLVYAGVESVSWERLGRGDYDATPIDTASPDAIEADCRDGDARWSFTVAGHEAVPGAVAYAVYRQGFALATAPTPDLLYQTFPETPREVCLQVRAIDQTGSADANTGSFCVDAGDEDTGGDTDEPEDTWTWPEDTWRDDWGDDTWNYWYDDYWYDDYWDYWGGPGCQGVTYRICGPRGPGSPFLIFPAVLALALLRRRQPSSP